MAQTFDMPKYGMTMEEGTVIKWRKNVGETIENGEVLLEIGADKAEMEVESDLEGVVLKILVDEDTTVECGTPLCWIGEAGETVD